MKILFAAPIYPPDVGGPSHYAYSLKRELEKLGNKVEVATCHSFRKIPSGLRHLAYFIKLISVGRKSDIILGFDSLSVGFPAVLVGKFLRKKVILRIGGDFLWEEFVERTQEKILLSWFYEEKRAYTLKEKIIFILTRFSLRRCNTVVFNTLWLRDIFVRAYGLDVKNTEIIDNAYGASAVSKPEKTKHKTFLWAGRPIFLKNIPMLRSAFKEAQKIDSSLRLEIVENIPHEELMEKIKSCYAIVYPSLSEVSPNLVLEGISCGKPSVVTKEIGIAGFLHDTALFVNPLDKKDITANILFLADEKNYREYCARIANFNSRHTYADIAGEYTKLIRLII